MKEKIIIVGSGAFLASCKALEMLHTHERNEVEIIDAREAKQRSFEEPIKFTAPPRYVPYGHASLSLPDAKNFINGRTLPFKKRKK